MRIQKPTRCGTIVPMIAISLFGILFCLSLAIDIGVLALARNQAQNAADASAMAGARALTGDVSKNNGFADAEPAAKAVAVANKIVGESVTVSQVATSIGWYTYSSSKKPLPGFTATFTGTKPATENWSACKSTISGKMPAFFSKIFGVQSLPVSATATAVHRPRDIAIVLDYSGSMGFGSEMAATQSVNLGTSSSPNWQTVNTRSLNPDTVYPKFGHWANMDSVMRWPSMSPFVDGGGEAHAANNHTITTENGPPIIRDFQTVNGSTTSNAFYNTPATYTAAGWAGPAPDDWSTQSSATATYLGDMWPRIANDSTKGYAVHVKDFLNITSTVDNTTTRSTVKGPGGGQFDPVNWNTPADNEGYGPNFQGYAMGPGYYGKTFYHWPPDPRYHPSANPHSPSSSNPAKDTSGNWMGDWRKRFFYNGGGTTRLDGNNSRLWNTSTRNWNVGSSTTYAINYTAVAKWLKTPPVVFPANLRAGRVVYYTSIPDTIPSSGGTRDQLFWRNYINYVMGNLSTTQQQQVMYGRQPDSDTTFGSPSITAMSSLPGGGAGYTNSSAPYMRYDDNPVRPRMGFWFGPLSMLCFLSDNTSSGHNRNWLPGTCHESQCWQLKVGINSALTDIEKNHPNDLAALIFFSSIGSYTTPRVTMGRSYDKMQNALFYPFSLLNSLSDPTKTVYPYSTSFGNTAEGEIPNARGGTCPESALMVAFNQLSSASGFSGRQSATKVVVFETDGVPNTQASGSFNNGGVNKCYYSSVAIGSYISNGDPGVIADAVTVVKQITAMDTASNPGYSTKRNAARVHAIAFGDLFQTTASQKTSALNFLLQVQQHGNTQAMTDTELTPANIITGDYNTRINNLRSTLERIMQSGVQVSLIE